MIKILHYFKLFAIGIISILLLHSCKSVYYNLVSKDNIVLSSSMNFDTTMNKTIKPYSDKILETMNEVLIHSDTVFETGKPEGLLGNLIADIMYDYYTKYAILMSSPKADFCIINNGGLRTSLYKGDITLGTIYSLMPFDNELVLIKLPGKAVKELFDYLINIGGQPISNANISNLNPDKIEIIVGKELFDEKKDYYILTSDYLANGNDQMVFFKANTERININARMRDIIINYLKKLYQVNSKIPIPNMGRIKLIEK